jgi:hypothetical protein
MENKGTICVTCAWRPTCNKKFSMDGSTTTKCVEYTKDVTLDWPKEDEENQDDREKPVP